MTTLYKLTDQSHETYGATKWGPGVTHTASGEGDLCGPGWLHAYTDPLLAIALNPVHANIQPPVLWRAEGKVGKDDRGLKVGCTSLTTIKVIELPVIQPTALVHWVILCARATIPQPASWERWADGWISGADRTKKAAKAARSPANGWHAEAVAWAASWTLRPTAVIWAAEAAEAAARAAAIDLAGLLQQAIAAENAR